MIPGWLSDVWVWVKACGALLEQQQGGILMLSPTTSTTTTTNRIHIRASKAASPLCEGHKV